MIIGIIDKNGNRCSKSKKDISYSEYVYYLTREDGYHVWYRTAKQKSEKFFWFESLAVGAKWLKQHKGKITVTRGSKQMIDLYVNGTTSFIEVLSGDYIITDGINNTRYKYGSTEYMNVYGHDGEWKGW